MFVAQFNNIYWVLQQIFRLFNYHIAYTLHMLQSDRVFKFTR